MTTVSKHLRKGRNKVSAVRRHYRKGSTHKTVNGKKFVYVDGFWKHDDYPNAPKPGWSYERLLKEREKTCYRSSRRFAGTRYSACTEVRFAHSQNPKNKPNTRIKEITMEALLKSLVGSSIEYRGSVRTIEDAAFKSRTLRTERDHIRKSLEMGSSLPEDVRLILYTELLDYYRNQPYYFEVRSSIVFGRDRAKVIDMLSRPSSERLDELEVRLSYGSKYPYREAIVCACGYFLRLHERYLNVLKPYLTAGELITCI